MTNAPPNKRRGRALTRLPSQSQSQSSPTTISADIHRTPPHSVEAERGVLGSMLISPGEAIAECVEKIDDKYFLVPAHRTIYSVLVDLWNAGQAIDLITFTQVLRDRSLLESVGGAAFVTSLFTFVPTAANVGYYIDIVRDKYILREIISAGTEGVRRAYAAGENEPAQIVAEFEDRLSTLREFHGRNGSGLPSIQDGAQLIEKPIILPDDVIEGVLHRGGKMVFGGASKSYKTWLLIDTGISVATGTDWLGKFPTKTGRVLFINLEIQAGFFAKRIKAICDERQLKLESGYLLIWNLRGCAADISRLLPQLLRGIGRDEYALIIIDPIYKVLGERRDENKAGDIANLLNQIEALAVATGAAVLFGAHYSKGNQASKEAIDRVGRSGVFARDPDTILNFTRHEEANCFTVEATLPNHPPIEPFVVRWEYPLFVVASELDPTQLKKLTGAAVKQFRAEQLADLLKRPMSAAQFRRVALDELGMSRATFFRLFAEVKTSGAITSTKGGKWKRT